MWKLTTHLEISKNIENTVRKYFSKVYNLISWLSLSRSLFEWKSTWLSKRWNSSKIRLKEKTTRFAISWLKNSCFLFLSEKGVDNSRRTTDKLYFRQNEEHSVVDGTWNVSSFVLYFNKHVVVTILFFSLSFLLYENLVYVSSRVSLCRYRILVHFFFFSFCFFSPLLLSERMFRQRF